MKAAIDFLFNESLTGLILTLLLICIPLIYGIRKYFAPKYIPGIPILKPNSVLGFTLISNQYVMKEYVEKYGSLLQFQLFGKHVILINDKVLAKKALRDVKGKGYFHNPKPSIIRKSTFTLDTGPDWQMRRNIFRKAFSNACLRTQISVMSQTINKLLVHLDTIALSGDAVMIDEVFIQLTIGVICNLGFDLDVKALDSTSNTCTHMNDTLKTVFKYRDIMRLPFSSYLYHLPFPPFSTYKSARLEFDKIKMDIWNHIRNLERSHTLRKDSLAEALIHFSQQPGIEVEDVLQEIGLFFIAGMDTTAHTLSFVIYALAVHNDIQQRAQLEVDTFIASGKKITDGMLPPYVEALLKESMRKYPTAATGSFREVKEEEGYQLTESIHLPRGYWIAINFYCLHNSKLNWGEDAEEFKPERWLDSLSDSNGNNTNNVTSKSTENNDIADPLLFANDSNKKIKLSSPAVYGGTGVDSADDLCYAPFSFGTRNCVGMNLALIEMRLSLFAILSKFSFDLANPDMKIERNALETSFTMRPAHGMPVYVRKR